MSLPLPLVFRWWFLGGCMGGCVGGCLRCLHLFVPVVLLVGGGLVPPMSFGFWEVLVLLEGCFEGLPCRGGFRLEDSALASSACLAFTSAMFFCRSDVSAVSWVRLIVTRLSTAFIRVLLFLGSVGESASRAFWWPGRPPWQLSAPWPVWWPHLHSW